MAIIPQYTDQNQRVKTEALPGVRLQTDAPAEAFGAGPSAQALSAATNQAFGAIEKVAQQQKYQADQAVHLKADTDLSELQTNIQLKVANLKGQDAINAPDVAKQDWEQGYQKVAEGMNNQAQKVALERSAAQRWLELNKTTLIHAHTEANNFSDQLAQSSMDQSKNAAVLNSGDDQIIQANVDKTKAVVQDLAARKGWDETILQDKTVQAVSPLHRDVIQARLDAGLDQPAKEYFEKNKEQMTALDIAHAKNIIDNQTVVGEGNALFNRVLSTPGLKFSDGTYNLEKVKDHLDLPEGLSDTKRQALENFITHRASEYNVNKQKQDQSIDREFMNKVYQNRKDGVPLSQTINLATKYGADQTDQAIKADIIGKIYAPPSNSDPAVFINLWEKTYDGEASRQDIDDAMQKGKINESDWRSLREADYKAKTDGTDPAHKNAWEWIKIQADENFGSNKDQKAKFMYDLHHDAGDKSPEELIKMSKDKLANDPNTGIWGFMQSKKFEADVKQSDAQSLALGTVYEDVGAKEAKAIGIGMSKGSGKSWGLKDIDQFSKEFGGYNAIKSGTPVNNAVSSLQKNGILVTPKNVKYLLERYPNGKWQK